MQTLNHVLDRAKKHSNIKSDSQLGIAIGRSRQIVSMYRTKRAFPDDDSMRALARLADIDENAALLMLNVWRTESQESKQIYKNILAKISGTAAAVAMSAYIWGALPSKAEAAQLDQPERGTMYIMRHILYHCYLCDSVSPDRHALDGHDRAAD